MDNLYDKDKFEKVWERVLEANGGHSKDTAEKMPEMQMLCEFMDDKASDEIFYTHLAKKCGDKNGEKLLRALSVQEAEHLKKLQIHYFIMTGDSYRPQYTVPYITSVLDAVRNRYIREVNCETAYQKAAIESSDGKLSQLYSEIAMDEAKHAKSIEKLIEKIIG